MIETVMKKDGGKMNHATNASIMRASNRKLILNLIRLRPISRVELSEQTHLTRASITQIVDELIEAGLVEAVSTESRSALGRRRIQLAICRDARYAFGVNIRRRRCYVGVIDLYGEVKAQRELLLSERTVEDVIEEIAEEILRQEQTLKLPRERIIGIGVSAPGPVEYLEGVVLNPPNFSRWHHVPVCRLLAERTGHAAVLEKDTNARVLEEKYFGQAQGFSNFMLVQIDDGVGSGVMIHDKLYRGTRGMGTEIGHTSICFDGPLCGCGNRGCLENYLRIPALLQGSRFDSWDALAADADSPDAAALIERAAEYLSTALVNAVNLYDLEKVIVSGDVARSPEALLPQLNDRVRARVLSRASVGEVPVIASHATAPVRTGAMAALHELFQDRM